MSNGAQKSATPIGRKLARAIEHKVSEDQIQYWREAISSNEKVAKLVTTVRIKGGMKESAFSDHVLYVSGAKSTSGNRTGARCVTDILISAGLIDEANGNLTVSVQGVEQAASLTNSEQQETTNVDPPPVQAPILSGVTDVARLPASFGGPQIAINVQIVIPETNDPEVLDAIFKSIKHNLFPQ